MSADPCPPRDNSSSKNSNLKPQTCNDCSSLRHALLPHPHAPTALVPLLPHPLPLISPHLLRSYFDAVINLVEGYCIFAFYKMLQLNAGGPEGVIQMIQTSQQTAPCYATCQRQYPTQCHSVIHLLLVQFMTLRPLMFLFIAILEQNPEKWEPLIRLLTILCIISLIVAMLALLRAYYILSEHAIRLRPTIKVLFVKGIVFILVVQELIIASYQKTGIFQTEGETLEEM